jgi:predicted nucleic acid-binding protein
LFDPIDVRKRRVAETLVGECLRDATGVISFQVVQEVLHGFTRKFQQPGSMDEARSLMRSVLVPLWGVMPREDLYRSCLNLQERYRYSFYDSLILAAALSSGCDRLYTEDLQHGQRIEGLTIVNPFA